MKFKIDDTSCAGMALVDLCKDDPEHEVVTFFDKSPHDIEHLKADTYNQFLACGINIPPYTTYDNFVDLVKNLPNQFPYVVKTDKMLLPDLRTVVVKSKQDAKDYLYPLKPWLVNDHKFILQDFIQGHEYNVLILMNNKNWVTVGTANDYKKQFDGDFGINTYGMGSVSPSRYYHTGTTEVIDKIHRSIISNYPNYQGFLNCQFIVDNDQTLWCLEVNARLGDPEFQSIAAGLDSGITHNLNQCFNNQYIDQVCRKDVNAVTIALIDKDWPGRRGVPMVSPVSPQFKIYNSTAEDGSRYGHVTISNHGNCSFEQLANDIYSWLDTIDTSAFYYRKDIGKM